MTKLDFEQLLSRGPVLLDGATGSVLRRAGMPRDAAAELWVLEHEQLFRELQGRYVEAGSQIIYAPTFQAIPLALENQGVNPGKTEAVISRLIALSRQAAEGKALVAGDMTTMAAFLDVSEPGNRATIVENYRRQIGGLLNAGVDLLVAETLLYPQEGELIWEAAALEGVELPMLYSFTMDRFGCLFSGQEAAPVLRELEEAGAAAVGFNCVAAGEHLGALVSRFRRQVRGPLISKPNAGDPVVDENGQVLYPMEAGKFAALQKQAFDLGARLLGGCCGTDPTFIRALRNALGQAPHKETLIKSSAAPGGSFTPNFS